MPYPSKASQGGHSAGWPEGQECRGDVRQTVCALRGCKLISSPCPGSFLTSKGENSEEDEDTEYFDAMEDSTSFITVITEAKEDR